MNEIYGGCPTPLLCAALPPAVVLLQGSGAYLMWKRKKTGGD